MIWLNAKDIDPAGRRSGGIAASASDAVGDEFIGIELDSPLEPGAPSISTFATTESWMRKRSSGRIARKTGDEWYVFTSFTPIDARRAFPCFDEPRFKTPWEMTIHVKRSDKAFANGRMISETEEPDGMKAVEFAETEAAASGGGRVRGRAIRCLRRRAGGPRNSDPRDHRERSRGGRQDSQRRPRVDVLPRLEAYTGIPYPFGKLDHLAVPELPFGATENPGLIVYQQSGAAGGSGRGNAAKRRARSAVCRRTRSVINGSAIW